jgi:glyoxylase-like metal-dependent hydrolase (beta-lactamase superfamily II)
MTTQKPSVEAFFDDPTWTLTYVVFDPVTRDAIIIDPVLDFDRLAVRTSETSANKVLELVKQRGLKVHFILETHAHADHLSGAQVLKQKLGAPVGIGGRITRVQETFKAVFGLDHLATDGSQFDRLIQDDETLKAGSLDVKALHTPGHTPACMSYAVGNAVFTGDALFMEDYGTGRCDFPSGSASELYDAITGKLYTLPDDTRVFVGHDYKPGGRELRYESTVGREKASNVQLKATTRKDDFVTFRQARDKTLSPPALLFQSVQVNVDAGRLPPPDTKGRRFLRLPVNFLGG